MLLGEGNDKIIKLHDELYTNILSEHLRKDIEFIPHIGIGLFAKKGYDLRNPKRVELDEEAYRNGLAEAKALNLDYTAEVTTLHLEELDDDYKEAKLIKEFILQ